MLTQHTIQHIVYKKVGDLEIKLTILLPKDATNVPVLLYFHGEGGLLQGSRTDLAPHLKKSVRKYKIALVTADYRLAPQVGILDIYWDVMSCIKFIRSSEGLVKQLESPGVVDTTRLAVSGNAAGGYLALLTGLYAEPKPQVVLAMYPITDPLGTFKNDQIYPQYYEDEEPDESKCIPYATIWRYINPSARVVSRSRGDDRDKVWHYVLSTGRYAEYLDFDGIGEWEYKCYENENWRIPKQVEEHGLPPTYICHGKQDVEIDIEQSDLLVGSLDRNRGVYKYEPMKGKEHGFDKQRGVEMESMYKFMQKHL